MANHLGSEGLIKLGATGGTATIAELRSWEFQETADTIEDTVLSDLSRTYLTGLKSWSGSATCFWDELDTNGQMALTVGAAVVLNFYPEGATAATSETYYAGNAIVTSYTFSAQTGGMVEAQFSFTGNGVLTKATLA